MGSTAQNAATIAIGLIHEIVTSAQNADIMLQFVLEQ